MEFNDIIFSTEINLQTAILRLSVSFLAGMLIGIEREIHSQPAGLRTHILISVGATLAMLVSIYIPQTYSSFQNGDPGRIAAQVVTGIGFLGAGAIIHLGVNVKGLTTAASIWAMSMLGLAIGAGLFAIGAIGTFIILFSLTIMDVFEKKFFHDKVYKRIELIVKKKNVNISDFEAVMQSMKIRISSVDIRKNTSETTDKITFYVHIPERINMQLLSESIEKTEGIIAFSVELMN